MMRKTLFILILLSLLIPVFVSAQKAYQSLNYRCIFNDAAFELKLANGYLAASTIKRRIFSGHWVMFYPDSGVPDNKNQLTFHAKAKQDYFILDNMQEFYDHSSKSITGHYWSGKTWMIIKFVLKR